MDDLMPIGEVSARSGLSPKRLRSYAAAGLLVPAAIDSSSGYRYYAPGQMREARLIDSLRSAGVPLGRSGHSWATVRSSGSTLGRDRSKSTLCGAAMRWTWHDTS